MSNKIDAENSVEQINSVDEANTSEIISSENEIKRTETVNGTGFKSFLKDIELACDEKGTLIDPVSIIECE